MEVLVSSSDTILDEEMEITYDPDSTETINEFPELVIDEMPIRELRKYVPDFNDQIFAYLVSCKIKTIGDFRRLNESKVRTFSARGKQFVYKNTVIRAVKQMNQIIPKIKL